MKKEILYLSFCLNIKLLYELALYKYGLRDACLKKVLYAVIEG